MKEKKEKKPEMIAQKDFVICYNEIFREIKKGDDLSDIQEIFLANLMTEGVLIKEGK